MEQSVEQRQNIKPGRISRQRWLAKTLVRTSIYGDSDRSRQDGKVPKKHRCTWRPSVADRIALDETPRREITEMFDDLNALRLWNFHIESFGTSSEGDDVLRICGATSVYVTAATIQFNGVEFMILSDDVSGEPKLRRQLNLGCHQPRA